MQEKRVHPRVQVDLAVSCEPKGGAAFAGVAKDVSMGGMFIESTEVVPFGTQVTIAVRVSGVDHKLPGTVRWAKPGGLGVQFGLLGARETHSIAQLLKR
ncbi:MAG: PilZ domain-containing protein [Polyangiaceae bacterium]|nr:PilZ domain-containing protein [Polyangiaceae bacterium]